MKTTLIAFLLCAMATSADAESFKSFTLSSDEAHLTITTSDNKEFDAPALPEQVGFQRPQISPDGRYIGWLALFPNCCTSYPIPLTLVVLDLTRQVHQFEGIKLATFQWCFEPKSTTVAFMQTQVHGTNFEHFEQRAISTGQRVAEYEYPNDEAENAEARKNAPAWVKCVPE